MRQHELNPADFRSSDKFSIFHKNIKIASKTSVGFNSLFYKFYSGTFLKYFSMIESNNNYSMFKSKPHTFVHASLF